MAKWVIGAAVSCAERATSDKLNGPDLAINFELCDLLNCNPGETSDVMKILKKRLGSKSSKEKLLALFVLDSVTKNCGDYIYVEIVKRDILRQMLKILKRKSDPIVRRKVLILLETWQYDLGGPKGRHPEYYAAYEKLLSTGVKFPPHEEENASPLFVVPERSRTVKPAVSEHEEAAIQASLQDISALSFADIKSAHEITEVLVEMLTALQPTDQEGAREEVITDLVDQCQSYQRRAANLIDNTSDEELLRQALVLNDELQHVVQLYADIIEGDLSIRTEERVIPSAPPIFDLHHDEDDALQADFTQFTSSSISCSPTSDTDEQVCTSSFLPALPSLRKPSNSDEGQVDHKSAELNKLFTPFASYSSKPPVSTALYSSSSSLLEKSSVPSPPSSDQQSMQSVTYPIQQKLPIWDSQSSSILLPPPPSNHSQRKMFFEQQQQQKKQATPGFSHQTLAREFNDQDSTQAAMPAKPEDTLFQDLVSLAKVKTRSSLH